jgi:hypothetical protein
VVSSIAYPHCQGASQANEISKVLRKLQSDATFNLAGREYVCQHFDATRTAAEFAERLTRLVETQRQYSALRHSHQAMRFLARRPWMLSRSRVELPAADDLPPEADALRAVICDAARQQAAASSEEVAV